MSRLQFDLNKLEELIELAMAARNGFECAAVFAAADVLILSIALQVPGDGRNALITGKLAEVGGGIRRLIGYAPAGSTRHGDAHQALQALGTVRLNLGV